MSARVSGGIPTLKTGHAHPHPEPISGASYSAVELMPDDRTLIMLDQRLLPQLERYERLTHVGQVAEAIRGMVIRGAPVLGIAAAYAMTLAAGAERGDGVAFVRAMDEADDLLRRTRPTARNLGWALDRMNALARSFASRPPVERAARFADEARQIHASEVLACKKIGALGSVNVPDGARILTYCNAGALATGGYGTALGVIRAAHQAGKRIQVIACETRPLLQGARLTAWELLRDGIAVHVITDSMAASLMAKRAIDMVIVGADRIARSGDVANKIGTYGIACLAHAHRIPFDVAAPLSTIDLACENGDAIPIEQRAEAEVTHFPTSEGDVPVVPDGVSVFNPSFDVTPAHLVRALVTERGVVSPLSGVTLVAHFA